MQPLKVVHELFLFKDDLFWNEAEIIRNEACTGMKRNKPPFYPAGEDMGALPMLCTIAV